MRCRRWKSEWAPGSGTLSRSHCHVVCRLLQFIDEKWCPPDTDWLCRLVAGGMRASKLHHRSFKVHTGCLPKLGSKGVAQLEMAGVAGPMAKFRS